MSETEAAGILGSAAGPKLDDATARRPLAVMLDVALIAPMAITLLGLVTWGAVGLLYASSPLWAMGPGVAPDAAVALWLGAAAVVLTVSLAAAALPMVAYIRWVARAHRGLTELRSPGMRLADIPDVRKTADVDHATAPDDVGGRAHVARLIDVLLALAALGWPAFAACAAIETMLDRLGVRGMYTVEAPDAMFALLVSGIAGFAWAWAAWARITWLRHRGADGGATIGCRVARISVMPDGSATTRLDAGGTLARRVLAVAVVLLIASSALPWTALTTFISASRR